jgi:hypothetical protein
MQATRLKRNLDSVKAEGQSLFSEKRVFFEPRARDLRSGSQEPKKDRAKGLCGEKENADRNFGRSLGRASSDSSGEEPSVCSHATIGSISSEVEAV